MKSVLVLLFGIMLGACAETIQKHGYNMSWSCNGNTRCMTNMRASSGAGQFQVESNCLVWETAFINNYTYPQATVTACTYF